MTKFSKKIQLLQKIQIALVAICIIAFLFFLVKILQPKISVYDVPDECGPIGGSVLHSIGDEDACRNACVAYCLSLDKLYHKSEFEPSQITCNACKCTCKEGTAD